MIACVVGKMGAMVYLVIFIPAPRQMIPDPALGFVTSYDARVDMIEAHGASERF